MSAESITNDVVPDTNRLVWVISKLEVPNGYDADKFWYRERFRSDMIAIPPARAKRVLMHYLAAQKFIGQTVPPSDPFPSGGYVHPETGEVEKDRFGKPLQIVELSSTEREKFEGMTPAQALKRIQELEEEQKAMKHAPEGANVDAVGTGKPQAHRTRRQQMPSASDVLSGDIQRIDGN